MRLVMPHFYQGSLYVQHLLYQLLCRCLQCCVGINIKAITVSYKE